VYQSAARELAEAERREQESATRDAQDIEERYAHARASIIAALHASEERRS
jgi:hypothetical protein